LFGLSDVFRRVVALVHVVTACVEFASWVPDDMQPHAELQDNFLFGQMCAHLLATWPPVATRAARFLSTMSAGMSSTSGLSSNRGWVAAGLVLPHSFEDAAASG
jgi:hypothetical protein